MSAKVPGNFEGLLSSRRSSNRLLTGSAIIVVGILLLIVQFVPLGNIGLIVLPVLGLILAGWGILGRKGGLFIPAGILLGIGAGTAVKQLLFSDSNEAVQGGILLISLAIGCILITVLTIFFNERTMWWALIPAAIFGLLGGTTLTGQLGFMAAIIPFWPVILILGGLFILRDR